MTPSSTTEPVAPVPARTRRWHWLLVAACTLYCHGLLLTNDGVHWDGWWLRAWLTSGNWAVNHEFFSAVGMPLYAYVNWPFAGLANPVPAMMLATVGCLLLAGWLACELAWRSGWLTPEEALAAALLGMAYPVFLAAQDIIMLFFIFTHTLFLASVLAALRAMDAQGGRAVAWRVAAVVGLFAAGSNAGLLAFQGASVAFLFACWRRRCPTAFWPGAGRFLAAHPDFLLLPLATWWFRHTFTPQFGAYAQYNQPKFGWSEWEVGFEQYLRATAGHLTGAVRRVAGEPWLLIFAGLLLVACWRWAPAKWQFQSGPARTRWLLAWGALALALGILPYVAAGKHLGLEGASSRSGLLLPLPAGLLLFALLRKALTLRTGRHGVLFWPLVGLSVVALGREYTTAYLRERAQWIQSRALLELMVEHPLFERSSYVRVLGDESALAAQVSYLTYGVGSATGWPLTRFVTAHYPISRPVVTPDQIERWMTRISGLLPRESLHINPAGSQIDVVGTLPRWPGTPADLVGRYLAMRWRGDPEEWRDLRRRLAQLECRLVREEVPLTPAPARSARTPSAPGQSDFVNGTGMEMVRLPAGRWAGKLEVTQAEYEEVMGANPSRFRDPLRPVECVSWHDAREFCRRLTATEARAGRVPPGHVYSLPTEALWDEFAAGTRLAEGVFNQGHQRWHTAPGGTLPANPQKLHDVRGNLWEWCLDWADPPKHFRLLKGECWSTERPARSPVNARQGMRPDQAFWNAGFRCVLVPQASLPAEFHQHP